MKTRILGALCGVLLLLLVGVVSAQSTFPPLAAVDADDALWFYPPSGEPRLVAEGLSLGARYGWDDSGQYLTFTRYNAPDNTSQLFVFDAHAGTVFALATGLAPGFPAQFTLDNSTILYAVMGDRLATDEPKTLVDIYKIAPQPDAAPEKIGSFIYNVGCGGGIESALGMAYAQETGTNPGWGYLTLAETPYGIVYSPNCGGRGGDLLDVVTGETVSLPGNFIRLTLSPDRTQAVVRLIDEDASLALVDLATLDFAVLPVPQAAGDVAWGGKDRIYFSAPRDEADEWGIWAYELSVRRLTLLYRAPDTYRLSRLTTSSDQSGLYFSQIVQPSADTEWDTPITVNLYRLDLQTGSAELIGDDWHQAVVSPLAR